jgi:hypothetical protein
VSVNQGFRVMRFLSFKETSFKVFCFQNFKVVRNQGFEISRYLDFRALKHLGFKESRFEEFYKKDADISSRALWLTDDSSTQNTQT